MDNLGYTKIKDFCTSKDTIKKMIKRQVRRSSAKRQDGVDQRGIWKIRDQRKRQEILFGENKKRAHLGENRIARAGLNSPFEGSDPK